MNGPNKLMFYYTRSERLVKDKHYNLWGPFISKKGSEVLWIGHRSFLEFS